MPRCIKRTSCCTTLPVLCPFGAHHKVFSLSVFDSSFLREYVLYFLSVVLKFSKCVSEEEKKKGNRAGRYGMYA